MRGRQARKLPIHLATAGGRHEEGALFGYVPSRRCGPRFIPIVRASVQLLTVLKHDRNVRRIAHSHTQHLLVEQVQERRETCKLPGSTMRVSVPSNHSKGVSKRTTVSIWTTSPNA